MTAARSILASHGPTVGVAGTVFWLAYDGGTYSLTSRGTLGILVWWAIAIALALGLWPRTRIPPAAAVTGGLLAAYAAFIGLSTFWAESEEKAFNEFDRAVLYLGIFLLPVLGSRPGRGARRWIYGMTIAIAAIGILALASRLFPASFSSTVAAELPRLFPSAKTRLSYPINYWNGLATFVAFGLPFLLLVAVSARNAIVRGLALAPFPALVAAMYLTSSRGGAIVGVLAILVFVALSGRPWRSAGAALVAAAGGAAAVGILRARPALVSSVLETNTVDGRNAAILIGLAGAAAGVAWALLSLLRIGAPRLHPAARIGAAAVIVAALVAGVLAADPGRRFESFKSVQPNLTGGSVQDHLLNTNSSGRWQLWQAAIDELQDAPALGHGAGSYEAWWAEHGQLAFFVRDAHSLYLESLAELGIVGLVLLVAFLASGYAAGLRRHLAGDGETRVVTAALLATLAAYTVEAGVDWLWELPAVSSVAFVCLGLLTGPATLFREPDGSDASARPRPRALPAARAAGALLALGLIAGQAIPYLAQVEVEESQAAVVREDGDAALEHARAATRVQPWASTPFLQLALVQEQVGDLRAARSSIADAIERDALDWRLWLVAARVDTKLGRFRAARASLERAIALNPRSPRFRSG